MIAGVAGGTSSREAGLRGLIAEEAQVLGQERRFEVGRQGARGRGEGICGVDQMVARSLGWF
jgi:hypothetical protein